MQGHSPAAHVGTTYKHALRVSGLSLHHGRGLPVGLELIQAEHPESILFQLGRVDRREARPTPLASSPLTMG